MHLHRCLSLCPRCIFSCIVVVYWEILSILIDLVVLFAQVGESTGFEVAPPNYVGIDHYFVCSWLNVAKKGRGGLLHKC